MKICINCGSEMTIDDITNCGKERFATRKFCDNFCRAEFKEKKDIKDTKIIKKCWLEGKTMGETMRILNRSRHYVLRLAKKEGLTFNGRYKYKIKPEIIKRGSEELDGHPVFPTKHNIGYLYNGAIQKY